MAKILVVDDDWGARRFLAMALGKYEVLQAGNGRSAIEIARREHPDLVLMDLMMPVLDGETAARFLKEDPTTARIPIVALSARTLSDEAEGCFDHYLSKPCRLTDLLKTVDACLNGDLSCLSLSLSPGG